jgi:D-galacturonate reductase
VCDALQAQPKQQLDTFRAWAGKSSDINFYLNSHHIDIHNWFVSHMAHPTRVTALAATGTLLQAAHRLLGPPSALSYLLV